MTDPGRGLRLPWGNLLAASFLVGLQVLLHRMFASEPAPWPAVWFSAGAGLGAFLVMRWLCNLPWGLVTGLLLPLHPAFRSAGPYGDAPAFLLALLTFAGTLAGWLLVFQPRFAWRSWSAGLLMLVGGTSVAWAFHPQTGLVVSLLTGCGLWAGAVLAIRVRPRRPRTPPAWGTISAALLLGVATSGGGLFLASAGVRFLQWPRGPEVEETATPGDLLQTAMTNNLPDNSIHVFSWENLQRWCWPSVWLTLPLMIWGFWRALRRGWKLWLRRQPPLAWMLAFYAVLMLAGETPSVRNLNGAGALSVASVVILLGLFGIADLLRGLMERMVLAPPADAED